ncbi:MAG TPA: energy transducer TonB [Terriglobales bacterium]|jgi:protein TonB|nr:energy transducer TonB [Terriglobales bacterium]
MFEDSILESSPRWRTRRPWTTLASSALQGAALTLLILVPALRPDALPLRFAAIATLPEPYRPTIRQGGTHSGSHGTTANRLSIFAQPREIPRETYTGPDPRHFASGPDVASPDSPGPGCPTCPPAITPDMSNVFSPPPIVPRPALPRPAAVSGGVIEGYLVQRVQPLYPHLAKLTGVQGDVILQAMIDRDGRIEQLQAVSGHPLLVSAALEAVRQWRYRPYRLNGQPVEVETQITVRFILSGH